MCAQFFPPGGSGSGGGGTSSAFGAGFPTTGTAIGFKDSTGTNMAAGNLDASGYLKVNVAAGGGSGGTSSSFGSAFPATGTAIGFKDSSGTNMAAGNLDASGYLKVNVAAGSGGNGAASNTGSSVPTQADYQGVNVSGTLRGQTGVNPSGSVYAAQQDLASIAGTTADTNSGNKSAGTLRVVIATDQVQLTNALKVDGSGVTQPISAASLPLPTGAATAAKQPALGTAGSASADVITVQGVTSMTPLKVDGSGVTQPISAASLPLPTGASTAAKQPALGTAGTPSADVITVQGVTSMTALKVDGSGVTQPISAASLPLPTGASTAAKQPALGTAGSASTDVITVQGIASMTALKIDGSGVTQPISAASLPLPTGASTAAKQPALGTAGTPSTDVITVQGVASMTALSVQGALSDNGASAGTNRVGMLPGIAESNLPSALTAGRDAALRTDLQGNLLIARVPATSLATYAAAKTGLATAASATDIAVLSGNSTNTVIVTKIMMSCTQTTAGIIDVQLLIRTTADSGGTSTGSPSAYPLDQNNASASSAVLTYTANPTVNDGTARLIDSYKLGVLAPGSVSPADVYIWTPSMGQSIVLRGTAQQAALNLNATTVTSSSCDIRYQWIETTGL